MVYFFDERPNFQVPEGGIRWSTIYNHLKQARAIMASREESCKALGVRQTQTELLILVLVQFLAKRLARDEVRTANNLENGLIEQLLIERGWCRRQVAFLTESLHVECLYMLSCIERPDPQFRHTKACEIDCIANKVDRSTYKTRHVCQSAACAFVAANQEKSFAILQAGLVPLIEVQDFDKVSEIEFLVTKRRAPYVAISHVWSHGLGNPEGNSLPRCQLARLSKMVASLYPSELGSVPFWIDTICVPTVPAEARALAIIKLRDTYRKADMVLVVDSYLETIDTSTLLAPEIALYISCSTWLTRLWTLQEGALAPTLYFQFADRVVDLAEIDHTLRHDRSSEDFGSLLGAVINYRHADYGDMNIPAAGLIQFLHASVRNRSTSYGSDEALCLATLAGLEMEDIARFTGEEDRMYHFWRLLRPTPSMMAFWTGPRLKTAGRRWAPSTLRVLKIKLDMQKAGREEKDGVETVITDRGLILRAPGLLLGHQDEWPVNTDFVVIDAREYRRFIVRKAGILYEPLSSTSESRHEGPVEAKIARSAIILKRGKHLALTEYDKNVLDDYAVLVRIEDGEPNQVLYSRLICNVLIDSIGMHESPDPCRLDEAAAVLPDIRAGPTNANDDKETILTGRMLSDDQQWCLG